MRSGNELARESTFPAFAGDRYARLSQVVWREILRHGLAAVPMNERINAAARATRGDAQEPLGRGIAETSREVRDDEKVVFFGDIPRLLIVFGDGGVFIAQIHLD